MRLPTIISAAALVAGTSSCGSSVPPPRQAMADVQAADRAATELGAEQVPNAQLHLRLAREQAVAARRLIDDGENERAADVIMRAKADAELALALTQEAKAKAEAGAVARPIQPNQAPHQTGGVR